MPNDLEDQELQELYSLDRDWQKQFHQLESLCIQAGFEVGYGEHGEVTLTSVVKTEKDK